MPPRFPTAALIVAVTCSASIACRGESLGSDRSRKSSARNVLFITVDTVRADHLPPYGYQRLTAPAITRLAREGVTFHSAFTPVPLTLPAHSSVFTGMQPFHHGVRDNGGFYLDPQRPTLATMLKANGFRTAAFVSAFVLDSRWGLASGFDRYFDNFAVSAADLDAMARVQRPGGETWAEARQWLDQHVHEKFFVWLHLFDPHSPYGPPEPYRSQYSDRPYDGEIAYSDSIIGQVIEYLEAKRTLDNTLVIFLSDHGEGLGDHGEDEHGLLAYDSTLHVPWIIRLPGRARAGSVVDRPVSLIDVVPTVLALLGVAAPSGLDGVNLAPLITGDSALRRDELYAETYYPRLRFNWSELAAVRNDEYKLIRAPRPELYQYRIDARESDDIASAHPAIVARLDQILNRMVPPHASATPVASAVDSDAARRLGSLGYIGGDSTVSRRSSQVLANPKDKTGIYRSLARARELLAKGSDRVGIELLEGIVLKEPELTPARRLLRDYWTRHGQARQGIAWFRTAAARHPDAAPLLVEIGALERAAHMFEPAISTFQRALALEAGSVDALTGMAETLRDMRRYDEALTFFRAAAAQCSDAPPRMRLAEALIKMGSLTEAAAVLASATGTDPHIAGAHYLLAQIAEQQHDLVRAEREYRLEMSASPWDYRAPFNLAALVGARDDHREQVILLESIPRIAPEFGEVFFYLAKALLDLGDRARFPDAVTAAKRGLQLAPESPSAPLGHYVLADIYNIEGRRAEAQRELGLGQQLEQRAAKADATPRVP